MVMKVSAPFPRAATPWFRAPRELLLPPKAAVRSLHLLGRRLIPDPRATEQTKSGIGGPRHGESIPTPTGQVPAPAPQDRSRIPLCLADAVAPPPSGIGWAVTAEMVHQCLEDHGPHSLRNDYSCLDKDLREQTSNWESLPPWIPGQPCEELFLFTDGSYYPKAAQATWAYVVAARQGNHVGTVGFSAGKVTLQPNNNPSAFQGELEGLLHALATACRLSAPVVHVGGDCSAALDIGRGVASFDLSNKVARAIQGFVCWAQGQGMCFFWHKVEAHTGCAFNETADAIAKQVGRDGDSPLWHTPCPSFDSAVDENLPERLWMTGPYSSVLGLPALLSNGTWPAQANHPVPQTVTLPLAGFKPVSCQLHTCKLPLRILQYNVLSLRGLAASALLAKGLRSYAVSLAGLQETREHKTGFSTYEEWWILSAPCTAAGTGGAQLWINPTQPGLRWEQNTLSIFHASPQVLVVLARVNGLSVALISAHAPPATSAEEILSQWWADLGQIIATIPPRFTLLQCIDANARFHACSDTPGTLASAPKCSNAKHLRNHALQIEAEATDQFSDTGSRLTSWQSPTGHRALLDYVLFPKAWKPAALTRDTPDLGDLHADYDHFPVLLDLDVTCEGRRPSVSQRIDPAALRTPAGQAVARAALATLPHIPWDICSTQHLEFVHRHLLHALEALPRAPPKPRNPALTQATLCLVRRKRHVQRCLRTVRQRKHRQCLWILSQVDSHASFNGAASIAQLSAFSVQEDRWYELFQSVRAELRTAMQKDRADFARRAISDAREAGPREFAFKLRAVLRTGRKFRNPPLLPVIRENVTITAGREPVLDAFAAFFAKPERARAVPLTELTAPQATCNTVLRDGTDLPSIVQLANAFAKQKSGKAPGVTQLPAEVFRSDPIASARAIWPILAKSMVRDPLPFQWRGGSATAIPKPCKDGSELQGYRSIMLLEPTAKAVQTAFRPQIQEAFVALRSTVHYGGLAGAPITLPAACTRAHLQALNALRLNGGAVFVDCKAAYYSVAREVLSAPPDLIHDDKWAYARAAVFFPDPLLQEGFVQALRSHPTAEALQARPALACFLRKQLDSTWFVGRDDSQCAMRAESGTAPGSPIADLLFGLVFQRFLHDINHCLQSQGYQAFATFSAPAQDDLSTPTWADDVCILFQTATPEEIQSAVQLILETVLAAMAAQGLDANLGAGKTEVMAVIHGQGSQAVKRALFSPNEPSVTFQCHGGTAKVRLVSEYIHLGCLLRSDGSEFPCITHRELQAQQIFRPVRKKLLNNEHLSRLEKLDLLKSRVLPSFLHGAGMLTLQHQKDRDRFEDAIFKIYRASFRPIVGVSSQGFSNTEILTVLGLATPNELLATARARVLADLVRANLKPILLCLNHTGLWWSLATQAAVDVGLLARQPTSVDELLNSLRTDNHYVSRMCRGFLRKGCRSRPADDVPLEPREAPETALPIAASGPSLPWQCNLCSNAYSGKRQLAVHLSRHHGVRPGAVRAAFGTCCQRCLREFWTLRRLTEHLARSKQCLLTYSCSDIPPEPPAPTATEYAWKPAMRSFGPQPWWSTLNPDVATACRDSSD